jgi:hypothetical protein
MAHYQRHHPYDPGFALPKYVRAEPPGRGSWHSFDAARGTISQRPKGWTGGFTQPRYVLAEPDRRGAIHSYDMARRSIGMRIPDPFGLGATPPPPRAELLRSITEVGEIKAKRHDRFRDHPLIKVGPWMFNPKGSRVEIHDGRLPSQGPHMRFLHHGVARVSKLCYPGSVLNFMCLRNYKGWSTEGSTVLKFGFNIQALKGDIPLYKVTNPIEGGNWGVYLTRKDRSIIVEFKKVPRTWWQKLGGLIKTIIGVIVDSVKALFDFMGVVACSLAKEHLGEVAALAAGKAALSPSASNWLNKAGVTNQELDILESGARASTSQLVANKIIRFACGAEDEPPPLTAEQSLPGWVFPVAIGAAGLTVIWLVTR